MANTSNKEQARIRSGFSLIELLTVVAICALLLALGVPGFQALIRNQRLSTSVNDFVGAIHQARSEAIRSGGRVDLAPLDGVDWAQGWIVFVDQDANQRADTGEKIIVQHGKVAGGMAIKSVLTDSSKPYLAYNGSGRTRTNASSQAPQLGTVSFFLDGEIRRIKLNFSGRARVCDPKRDKTCTGTDDTG